MFAGPIPHTDETSNIYDGSQFTPNGYSKCDWRLVIRVQTWVSFTTGGGVGWGEVINGGFWNGTRCDPKKHSEKVKKICFFTMF